tara:strand:- start:249 stop:377 length:129 start_codon:yes stop_codon:yes gene_type:complete
MEREFSWTNKFGETLSVKTANEQEQSNLIELFEAEGVEYKLN